MIFDSIPVGPIETNCYLIGDEAAGVCAVIDPGADPEKVLAMVEKSGLRLEKILLTHGHYDHVGAVKTLTDAAAVPVYIHKADTQVGDARIFPPLPAGHNYYENGGRLSVGSLEIKILHTPGHSPGSVTLLAEDRMFCGDTLFALGCGRWDLPGGDMHDLMGSLADLGFLKGNYQVYPGHGEDTNLDFERKNNPYLKQAMEL